MYTSKHKMFSKQLEIYHHLPTSVVQHLHHLPPNPCTGQSTQVHTYNDDVFALLNSHQELTLGNLDEIWKQSTPEEAEKLESESEPKAGTVMIGKLTKGLDTVKLAS